MNLPPDLPTGPLAPLPPRSGALVAVRRAARDRRHRRLAALCGGAASILLLAFAVPLALPDGDGPRQNVHVADDGRDPAPSSTSTSVEVVDNTDEGAATTTTTTTTYVKVVEGTEAWPPFPAYQTNDPAFMVGRTIGPDQQPIGGVHVYTGPTFRGLPRPAAMSDEDGWYQIPCPTSPVVVSGAQLSTFAGNLSQDLNLVPTVVAMPDGTSLHDMCGSGGIVSTVLPWGGVIEGVVRNLDAAASGSNIYIAVEMPWPTAGDCQGMPSCYFFEVQLWSTTEDQATFRVVGLPPGDVTVHRAHAQTAEDELTWIAEVVHVESAEITHVEWEVPEPSNP